MNEQTPLQALYRLSAQFKSPIEQLGGRLLKVVFEWDGREVIFNHDDRSFPTYEEPPREMVAPPPGAPRAASVPPPPPPPILAPPAVEERPPATQMIRVDGFDLPIPPCAFMTDPPKPPEVPKPSASFNTPRRNKHLEPVEGITPLTDDDICPIQKKHPNTRMADVPSDYLDWLLGQPWLKIKHPQLWAYIVRHKDVIQKDIPN